MNGQETWADTCKRVIDAVCGSYLTASIKDELYQLMYERKFIPGGRYLYSAGRPYHQISNCFVLRAEDTREGWGDLMSKATMALMGGGGIGVCYNALRAKGTKIYKTGGEASGPLALMHMINEAGRYIQTGGNRRSAIFGSLLWSHPDIEEFLTLKNYTEEQKKNKINNFLYPLPMDGTNISVDYDTEFFVAIENVSHPKHELAKKVWKQNCLQAFSTAEPGFMFNFLKDNENLRNACTEVVSEEDSDKCNLGTIWINKFNNRDEFAKASELVTKFLLCGNLYSDYPYAKIKEVGLKSNRIGVGLGGIHEWLILNGFEYECTPELHKWLNVYEQETNSSAYLFSKEMGLPVPKGKRAIAPCGTLSILAETTSGIEPLFCKAYKRRYLKEGKWVYQYVIDGAVKRLIDKGISLEKIQDSYDLTFEQRVKFQADVQNYIDQAISSTANLMPWESDTNNTKTLNKYSQTLLKYAKRLRGFTCYPDGARGGQPLTKVTLEEAFKHEGKVFEETEGQCINGVCGL